MKTEDLENELDIFGCSYCAGVGYEDYPLNTKPCRINSHKDRYEKNFCVVTNYFNDNPLPEPLIGKPRGNFEWTGHGWKNLDYGKVAI